MSPGVSLEEPIAARGAGRGIEVLGDIELFARARARAGDRHHRHERQEHGDHPGGAHGRRRRARRCSPAAISASRRSTCWSSPCPILYVLELSSFQLETTSSLRAAGGRGAERQRRPSGPLCLGRRRTRAPRREFSRKAATVVLNADDPLVCMAMRGAAAVRGADAAAHRHLLHRARGCGFLAAAQRRADPAWRAAARRCSTSRA